MDILCVHPSVGGHLACFFFFTVMILGEFVHKYLCGYAFLVFLSIYMMDLIPHVMTMF